jgi:hypothetical protein
MYQLQQLLQHLLLLLLQCHQQTLMTTDQPCALQLVCPLNPAGSRQLACASKPYLIQ